VWKRVWRSEGRRPDRAETLAEPAQTVQCNSRGGLVNLSGTPGRPELTGSSLGSAAESQTSPSRSLAGDHRLDRVLQAVVWDGVGFRISTPALSRKGSRCFPGCWPGNHAVILPVPKVTGNYL
jgi:hypothetical protein